MPDSLRNWQTSLPGLVVLVIVGVVVIIHPEMLSNPVILALLGSNALSGLGLLQAKDANKSGTSARPTPKE